MVAQIQASKINSYAALDQTDIRTSKINTYRALDQKDARVSKLVTYLVLDAVLAIIVTISETATAQDVDNRNLKGFPVLTDGAIVGDILTALNILPPATIIETALASDTWPSGGTGIFGNHHYLPPPPYWTGLHTLYFGDGAASPNPLSTALPPVVFGPGIVSKFLGKK